MCLCEHTLHIEVHHLLMHVHLVLLFFFFLPGLWSPLQLIRHLRLMTHHAQRMCCRVLQNLSVQCLNSLSLLPKLVVFQPALHICHFLVLPAMLVAFCSIAFCPMGVYCLLSAWRMCVLPFSWTLPYDCHMSKGNG